MLVDNVINTVKKTQQTKHSIEVEVTSHSYSRVEAFRDMKKIKSIPLAAEELIDDGLDVHKI